MIVGLDLSLRCAGMCRIPTTWNARDVADLQFQSVGYPLEKGADEEAQIDRMYFIATEVAKFCEGADHIWVENYAFSQGLQSHARSLAELGGAVKMLLRVKLGLIVRVVTASAARKTLLQRLPRKGAKKYTHDNLERIREFRALNGDMKDAFVVANHAFGAVGGVAMTFPSIRVEEA